MFIHAWSSFKMKRPFGSLRSKFWEGKKNYRLRIPLTATKCETCKLFLRYVFGIEHLKPPATIPSYPSDKSAVIKRCKKCNTLVHLTPLKLDRTEILSLISVIEPSHTARWLREIKKKDFKVHQDLKSFDSYTFHKALNRRSCNVFSTKSHDMQTFEVPVGNRNFSGEIVSNGKFSAGFTNSFPKSISYKIEARENEDHDNGDHTNLIINPGTDNAFEDTAVSRENSFSTYRNNTKIYNSVLQFKSTRSSNKIRDQKEAQNKGKFHFDKKSAQPDDALLKKISVNKIDYVLRTLVNTNRDNNESLNRVPQRDTLADRKRNLDNALKNLIDSTKKKNEEIQTVRLSRNINRNKTDSESIGEVNPENTFFSKPFDASKEATEVTSYENKIMESNNKKFKHQRDVQVLSSYRLLINELKCASNNANKSGDIINFNYNPKSLELEMILKYSQIENYIIELFSRKNITSCYRDLKINGLLDTSQHDPLNDLLVLLTSKRDSDIPETESEKCEVKPEDTLSVRIQQLKCKDQFLSCSNDGNKKQKETQSGQGEKKKEYNKKTDNKKKKEEEKKKEDRNKMGREYDVPNMIEVGSTADASLLVEEKRFDSRIFTKDKSSLFKESCLIAKSHQIFYSQNNTLFQETLNKLQYYRNKSEDENKTALDQTTLIESKPEEGVITEEKVGKFSDNKTKECDLIQLKAKPNMSIKSDSNEVTDNQKRSQSVKLEYNEVNTVKQESDHIHDEDLQVESRSIALSEVRQNGMDLNLIQNCKVFANMDGDANTFPGLPNEMKTIQVEGDLKNSAPNEATSARTAQSIEINNVIVRIGAQSDSNDKRKDIAVHEKERTESNQVITKVKEQSNELYTDVLQVDDGPSFPNTDDLGAVLTAHKSIALNDTGCCTEPNQKMTQVDKKSSEFNTDVLQVGDGPRISNMNHLSSVPASHQGTAQHDTESNTDSNKKITQANKKSNEVNTEVLQEGDGPRTSKIDDLSSGPAAHHGIILQDTKRDTESTQIITQVVRESYHINTDVLFDDRPIFSNKNDLDSVFATHPGTKRETESTQVITQSVKKSNDINTDILFDDGPIFPNTDDFVSVPAAHRGITQYNTKDNTQSSNVKTQVDKKSNDPYTEVLQVDNGLKFSEISKVPAAHKTDLNKKVLLETDKDFKTEEISPKTDFVTTKSHLKGKQNDSKNFGIKQLPISKIKRKEKKYSKKLLNDVKQFIMMSNLHSNILYRDVMMESNLHLNIYSDATVAIETREPKKKLGKILRDGDKKQPEFCVMNQKQSELSGCCGIDRMIKMMISNTIASLEHIDKNIIAKELELLKKKQVSMKSLLEISDPTSNDYERSQLYDHLLAFINAFVKQRVDNTAATDATRKQNTANRISSFKRDEKDVLQANTTETNISKTVVEAQTENILSHPSLGTTATATETTQVVDSFIERLAKKQVDNMPYVDEFNLYDSDPTSADCLLSTPLANVKNSTLKPTTLDVMNKSSQTDIDLVLYLIEPKWDAEQKHTHKSPLPSIDNPQNEFSHSFIERLAKKQVDNMPYVDEFNLYDSDPTSADCLLSTPLANVKNSTLKPTTLDVINKSSQTDIDLVLYLIEPEWNAEQKHTHKSPLPSIDNPQNERMLSDSEPQKGICNHLNNGDICKSVVQKQPKLEESTLNTESPNENISCISQASEMVSNQGSRKPCMHKRIKKNKKAKNSKIYSKNLRANVKYSKKLKVRDRDPNKSVALIVGCLVNSLVENENLPRIVGKILNKPDSLSEPVQMTNGNLVETYKLLSSNEFDSKCEAFNETLPILKTIDQTFSKYFKDANSAKRNFTTTICDEKIDEIITKDLEHLQNTLKNYNTTGREAIRDLLPKQILHKKDTINQLTHSLTLKNSIAPVQQSINSFKRNYHSIKNTNKESKLEKIYRYFEPHRQPKAKFEDESTNINSKVNITVTNKPKTLLNVENLLKTKTKNHLTLNKHIGKEFTKQLRENRFNEKHKQIFDSKTDTEVKEEKRRITNSNSMQEELLNDFSKNQKRQTREPKIARSRSRKDKFNVTPDSVAHELITSVSPDRQNYSPSEIISSFMQNIPEISIFPTVHAVTSKITKANLEILKPKQTFDYKTKQSYRKTLKQSQKAENVYNKQAKSNKLNENTANNILLAPTVLPNARRDLADKTHDQKYVENTYLSKLHSKPLRTLKVKASNKINESQSCQEESSRQTELDAIKKPYKIESDVIFQSDETTQIAKTTNYKVDLTTAKEILHSDKTAADCNKKKESTNTNASLVVKTHATAEENEAETSKVQKNKLINSNQILPKNVYNNISVDKQKTVSAETIETKILPEEKKRKKRTDYCKARTSQENKEEISEMKVSNIIPQKIIVSLKNATSTERQNRNSNETLKRKNSEVQRKILTNTMDLCHHGMAEKFGSPKKEGARSPTGHRSIRYSLPRHSPLRHSPIKHSPIRRSPIRYSPTRHSPTGYSPTGHSPTRHSPTANSPTGHSHAKYNSTRYIPIRCSPTRHSPTGRSHRFHQTANIVISPYLDQETVTKTAHAKEVTLANNNDTETEKAQKKITTKTQAFSIIMEKNSAENQSFEDFGPSHVPPSTIETNILENKLMPVHTSTALLCLTKNSKTPDLPAISNVETKQQEKKILPKNLQEPCNTYEREITNVQENKHKNVSLKTSQITPVAISTETQNTKNKNVNCEEQITKSAETQKLYLNQKPLKVASALLKKSTTLFTSNTTDKNEKNIEQSDLNNRLESPLKCRTLPKTVYSMYYSKNFTGPVQRLRPGDPENQNRRKHLKEETQPFQRLNTLHRECLSFKNQMFPVPEEDIESYEEKKLWVNETKLSQNLVLPSKKQALKTSKEQNMPVKISRRTLVLEKTLRDTPVKNSQRTLVPEKTVPEIPLLAAVDKQIAQTIPIEQQVVPHKLQAKSGKQQARSDNQHVVPKEPQAVPKELQAVFDNNQVGPGQQNESVKLQRIVVLYEAKSNVNIDSNSEKISCFTKKQVHLNPQDNNKSTKKPEKEPDFSLASTKAFDNTTPISALLKEACRRTKFYLMRNLTNEFGIELTDKSKIREGCLENDEAAMK